VAYGVPETELDEPLQEGGSPGYKNLHGYIQHAVCHGGQIYMLKRLIGRELTSMNPEVQTKPCDLVIR